MLVVYVGASKSLKIAACDDITPAKPTAAHAAAHGWILFMQTPLSVLLLREMLRHSLCGLKTFVMQRCVNFGWFHPVPPDILRSRAESNRLMNQRATIPLQQIATEAGVSRATVSRALRNHPSIPADTRARIQSIAQRLGHESNPLVTTLMSHVRAIRSGKHLGTLAYLTAWSTRDGWKESTADHAYFRGALDRATRSGHRLEEFWLKEPGMTGRRMSQVLDARGIRGVLVAPLPFPPARGHLSLDWARFAAVALGYSVWRPNLDRVASHHSNNLVRAFHQLRRLGYRRIGLALTEELDERMDRNIISSFQFLQQGLAAANRLPVHVIGARGERELAAWIRDQRPDVVVSFGGPARTWMRELGLKVPDQIGFVELDLADPDGRVAGIHQHSKFLAATAVDLLIAQLHRSEYGLPTLPKLILLEGSWVDGTTVRPQKT